MPRFDAKTKTIYDLEQTFDPALVKRLLINGQHVDIVKGSYREWQVVTEDARNMELFSATDEYNNQTIMGPTSRVDAMWLDNIVPEP